ncbi:hypothetical protein RJT34_11985 [Clitoria ternatea]|uniref:Uncharacterized protein n=1 Tax=Clitoria ternatea TaxID=43366 RepID=A0AAN9JMY4_CLITE
MNDNQGGSQNVDVENIGLGNDNQGNEDEDHDAERVDGKRKEETIREVIGALPLLPPPDRTTVARTAPPVGLLCDEHYLRPRTRPLMWPPTSRSGPDRLTVAFPAGFQDPAAVHASCLPPVSVLSHFPFFFSLSPLYFCCLPPLFLLLALSFL